MRTISLTAYNRPQYLKLMLESLSKNDLSRYNIMYCGIEPGNDEVIELIKSINFIDTNIVLNKEVLGVRKNPHNLLCKLFEDGSEFNVYLEDDIILSSDTLNLSNFFFDFTNEYIMCSFYHYLQIRNEPDKLIEWNNFVATGICFTKEVWEQYIKWYWFNDSVAQQYYIGGTGWDWSLRAMILKHDFKVLVPVVPRSKHIGVFGTYCSPGDYRKMEMNKRENYFGNPVYDFIIERKNNDENCSKLL